MVPLQMLPLILVLVQPVATQVQVNFSSDGTNSRLVTTHPTSWTPSNNGLGDKNGIGNNALLHVHPDDTTKNMVKRSTLKMDLDVGLSTSISGLIRARQPTVGPVPTVPSQNSETSTNQGAESKKIHIATIGHHPTTTVVLNTNKMQQADGADRNPSTVSESSTRPTEFQPKMATQALRSPQNSSGSVLIVAKGGTATFTRPSSSSPTGGALFHPGRTSTQSSPSPVSLQPKSTVESLKHLTTLLPEWSGSKTTAFQHPRPKNDTSHTSHNSKTTRKHTSTGTTSSHSTTPPPMTGRERWDTDIQKDFSVPLGYLPDPNRPTFLLTPAPCTNNLGACASSTTTTPGTISNRTLLVWADLSRTLSFAWELHIFGSATLFLLLAAGSAVGLALAPGMHCPHRGALAFANGLLFLVGTIRAIFFLLDPYGSRSLLPLPAMTALYTLPLPLLIWVQTALVVLVLKGAEMVLLHPSLQSPPLLTVLAVLQCTLLIAVDSLSPALSSAVPVVLQSLSLTLGLVLCLGYLCLVLPRLYNHQIAPTRDKGLSTPKLKVLVRVLAVCALLGAVCCLLHAYTCLWLYGLLGNWRHFRWAWWLIQFWARLLELAWAFCLLLMASWVFWRPRGRALGQSRGPTGDITSPCPSSSSSHTHTCWAKIVQSLKGRPYLKSESNGVSGANSGGVAGELPNNWLGQDRTGADISKNLIRNRDPPKESNHGRNQRSTDVSSGSLPRLQALGRAQQYSMSGSLDRDKETTISLYDFDLRPPSPIDLSRSIDEALHREHLLRGGSLFRPLGSPSPPPSPRNWLRRNSDPQIMLSDSSDEHTLTESSSGLDRPIPSAVPSRQVTAPPTPTHQGPRWISKMAVPSSVSCPISLHPSPSLSQNLTQSREDTRPFLTPDLGRGGPLSGTREEHGYLKVSRHDDSASVSSEIIDL